MRVAALQLLLSVPCAFAAGTWTPISKPPPPPPHVPLLYPDPVEGITADPVESVQLGPVIEQAIRLVGHALGPSEATLRCDLEPGVWVRGRPSELQQIVVNLVRNAADASGPDGWVRVKSHCDGGWAVLVVEDSGDGIAEEHLPQVFDPFFTTKAPGKGTGLGLHVVYRLVSSQRGSIVASNHPGGGACFEVRLPIGVAP